MGPPPRQAMLETEVRVSRGGAADAPPAPPRCRSAPHRGPQSTSPAAPTAPAWAPAGSARHARRAPAAPGQLPHLQPQRHGRSWRRGRAARQLQEPATKEEDRAPLRAAAELAVDGQPQHVAVNARLRSGSVGCSSTRAAQHVHGPMIAQPTPPGGAMPAPGRRSKRTRNVMQGSVLIPSYGRSSRFGHEADHLIAPPTDPERGADQRFRWSEAMWSPPPESNRRPHPYHGTTRNRCADRRFPRSRPTVWAEVIGSPSVKLCVHHKPGAAHCSSKPSLVRDRQLDSLSRSIHHLALPGSGRRASSAAAWTSRTRAVPDRVWWVHHGLRR